MFDVQDVSLIYGERVILDQATFKVDSGERAAIVGPNGTGKSTLVKIVAGVIKPEKGRVAIPKGMEVGYLPQHLDVDSELTVIEECRTVYQEVLDHEKEMRVLEGRMTEVDCESEEFMEIADRYEFLLHETQRRDLYSMDATISKVLDGLGFSAADMEKRCNALSGGWQMRMLLAKLLLQNPDVLLLDEPTNHLDIESIQWLGEWIKQHEGSVLMVSHERAFMDSIITKVIEIDRGNVNIYRGNYSQAEIKRAEHREMQQRRYENNQRERGHMQQFIDRFRYQASKAALVQSRIRQLDKLEVVEAPQSEQQTINFKFPAAPRSAKEVIFATNISRSFTDKQVLNNVDLTLFRGEKVALVGHNGAGKTTLMRILAGRDDKAEGKVEFGANVECSYFAQYDNEDLHPNNTVLGEFLSTAPLAVSDRARGILGAFLFSGDDVEKQINMLSGGERTRLRLAKMLCSTANLLMLDEPTNHLDIGSRLTLEHALRQYEGSIVLVSHDRYFLDNVVDRVVEIADGQAISYPGNYSEYLRMKEVADGGKSVSVRTKAEKKAAAAMAPTAKESHEVRKERKEREKAAKNRLRKAQQESEQFEASIAQAEAQITEIENELSKPEIAADFEKAAELSQKLDAVRSKHDELLEKWTALEEEVEELEGILENAG